MLGDVLPGYGKLNVDQNTQQYSFSQIQFSGSGIAGPLAIETVNYEIGEGTRPLNALEWQRFNRYELGQPVPKRSQPRVWSEFGQGTAGTLWVNALDGAYTLDIKARLHPADLVDDTSPDAIPYLWSDAVPFLAAWYAYMALQRQADADKAQQRFAQMMQLARGAATPTTQPGQFPGTPDPFMAGRLGVGGGGGQRAAQPRQQSPPTAA